MRIGWLPYCPCAFSLHCWSSTELTVLVALFTPIYHRRSDEGRRCRAVCNVLPLRSSGPPPPSRSRILTLGALPLMILRRDLHPIFSHVVRKTCSPSREQCSHRTAALPCVNVCDRVVQVTALGPTRTSAPQGQDELLRRSTESAVDELRTFATLYLRRSNQ